MKHSRSSLSTVAGFTHIGCVRSRNEDNLYFETHPHKDAILAVIADGMGGHAGGAMASRLTIEAYFRGWKRLESPNGQWLCDTAVVANNLIRWHAEKDPSLKDMGTTLVAFLLIDGVAHVVNIGDSRCYHYSKRKLTQITTDHSLVQSMVDKGSLTPEQAEQSPIRNYLTRSLGSFQNPEVDYKTIPVNQGDRLLLCSDGLSNMLKKQEISVLLRTRTNDEYICQTMIELALLRGASDNISVIVCTV
ncbi:MAG TPA: Stp1/IreP family PP2C-type Ser/Thr phosphatase [Pseudomonadales bacterium]|nr:Stp1/IreP family PP2C-type Ser/Thr phosphatase [Pseudomonadales bacterium]